MTIDEREGGRSDRTNDRVSDMVAAVVVIAFGLAVWLVSGGFPGSPVRDQVDPSFWPRAVAGALVGFGGILLVMSLLGRGTPTDAEPVNPAQRPALALVLGILVAYPLAWQLVGFLPATLVAFLLLSKVLGIARWWRAALWSLVLTLVVWGLFRLLLGVPL